jgi:hypothetical protein
MRIFLSILTVLPLILKLIEKLRLSGNENPQQFYSKTKAESICPHCKTHVIDGKSLYSCNLQNNIVKQKIPRQYTSTGVRDLKFINPCTMIDVRKCRIPGDKPRSDKPSDMR